MKQLIGSFLEAHQLGSLRTEPQKVTGGLMHTMYRVETTNGTYALKQLNADIMKRPAALQNMINSERISNALKSTVPLIAAKTISGSHVAEYKGYFWMAFDWMDGTSIFPPDVTEHHCALVGDLLGRIHAAKLHIDGMVCPAGDKAPFAWNELLMLAKAKKSDILPVLQEHIHDILLWDAALHDGWQYTQQDQVISHRDLDPKNILWKDDQPFIIDWEAAGYVHPAQELVEVINYWIADENGLYSRGKFDALFNRYTAHVNLNGINWDAVLGASFAGMLGWLEYNVKRSLGLEGSTENDQTEGGIQVRQTIRELCRYQQQTHLLHEWIIQTIQS